MPRAQKDTDFGLPKAIDRLHRVAHGEYGAPVVRLPSRRQPFEQFPLADRGILEFVDQDVLDADVERQQEIGGRIGLAQRAHRALGNLGEVGLAALGKYHQQLSGCPRQQLEHRVERFPLRRGIFRRRQCKQRRERGQHCAIGINPRERLRALMPLAPLAFLGKQFLRQLHARVRHQLACAFQEALPFRRERRFQFGAQRRTASLAQPLVAARQHRGNQHARGFGVVVEMSEQPFRRLVWRLERERAARGLGIEFARVFDAFRLCAEAREHRHLARE